MIQHAKLGRAFIQLVIIGGGVLVCTPRATADDEYLGGAPLYPTADGASFETRPEDLSGLTITLGQRIPMRDGVRLNAVIYRTTHPGPPLPVLMCYYPYGLDRLHDFGRFFATHGYVFVGVECRGMGRSEGGFDPCSLQEGKDGYDAVEFLAAQPWCNGSVGMFGGSWSGWLQWATAKEFPPHLKVISPRAAPFMGCGRPPLTNIWGPYLGMQIKSLSTIGKNGAVSDDYNYWNSIYLKMYLEHRAFKDLDLLTGDRVPIWEEWVRHPSDDAFWESRNPTPSELRAMDLPILTVTGAYDAMGPASMEVYRRHLLYGSPEGKARHYLIIGPWDHDGTRTPVKQFCGLEFGDSSVVDMNELHRQWYDWVLKGSAKPEFLKGSVAYYVIGKDTWKYASSLDEIGRNKKLLYLRSGPSGANDVFHSGDLSESSPADELPDHYVYNPLDTPDADFMRLRPPDSGKIGLDEGYLDATDQAVAVDLRGNGLVYHTAPFAKDTEIAGQLKLHLWLALNVLDTDFQAKLYEITPTGASIQVAFDQIRARYRESRTSEKLVTPGEINEYVFERFMWISRVIHRGSRLRLVVRCPNDLHIEKNYNSGKPVAEETGADAVTAKVTLYHDPEHPSRIELPLGD
jgi:uncharacterized protein